MSESVVLGERTSPNGSTDTTQEIPRVQASSALARMRDAINSATETEETIDYEIPLKTKPQLVARFRMLTIDEQEQIARARGRMREGALIAGSLDVLSNCCMNIMVLEDGELIANETPLTFTSPEIAGMLGVEPRAEEVIPILYPGGHALGTVEALVAWSGLSAVSAIEVNRPNSRKTQPSKRPRSHR